MRLEEFRRQTEAKIQAEKQKTMDKEMQMKKELAAAKVHFACFACFACVCLSVGFCVLLPLSFIRPGRRRLLACFRVCLCLGYLRGAHIAVLRLLMSP